MPREKDTYWSNERNMFNVASAKDGSGSATTLTGVISSGVTCWPGESNGRQACSFPIIMFSFCSMMEECLTNCLFGIGRCFWITPYSSIVLWCSGFAKEFVERMSGERTMDFILI